ncbi:SBF-domain-containing protein [Neocallimastix californiae]|uniref:SBF-domain-containing protein n=1 Tax=Neocallimastix californiae TaxID=1754190 RepID=A0A1Y2FTF2_9FUNG|nr:SBF-domain-containing protein [Neocallimastix californiae]|eukprot:ORY87283.1 SBF-domain-containing protein [Neocallimastix californiae]
MILNYKYLNKILLPYSIGNIKIGKVLTLLTQTMKSIIILQYTTFVGLKLNFKYNFTQKGILTRNRIQNSKNNHKSNEFKQKMKFILEEICHLLLIIFCNVISLLLLYLLKCIIPVSFISRNSFYHLNNSNLFIQIKNLNKFNEISLPYIIDCIKYIYGCIINYVAIVTSIVKLLLPLLYSIIMIKAKQPGKHYSLKLIFITLLLTINCQKPTTIEFQNHTRNTLNDLSSTSENNLFNLSNEWWDKIFSLQNIVSSYSLFNLPMVKSENIADEDIAKVEDVELSVQSQCLEQNRIFLSEQDQRVNFDIILSRPPSSNINITFINDKPDLFEIQPDYIFYKNAYYSTTSNNSVVTLLEKNYNLTTHFTVKALKDRGNSNLKFIIDTGLNIIKDDNTVLQISKMGNNGRLLLDKSFSNYLELRATSSNIGAMNIFLILWIVLFMFSLGLSFSGNTLKGLYKWKKLKPFICGYVCQLIINPLVAFILTKIFKLSDYISLGVIIVAASPGSFIAPVFTYYLGGDRALAVGLCLVATILGSFTFPLAIWLFCFVLSIKIETYIPFWETFSLTATQIVPLGVGCLILHFKPNWASNLKKGAPIWAFAIILTSLITSLKNYGQIFVNRWEAYSMPIILGIISYAVGFVFPRTVGLNNQEVRAICFNTGLQNSPLAIAVIQVLGMPSCSNLISLVPLHHSLWTVLEDRMTISTSTTTTSLSTPNDNHQQQIPIIYIHNTNNQSSSPIIAYSPHQNSLNHNTHSSNESSRQTSIGSNNSNHTPTKSETNSTSSKEEEKMNDHRNSHSSEDENKNTTSSIHSLNLNRRDNNNKSYPYLNNSHSNSNMSMNMSMSNSHSNSNMSMNMSMSNSNSSKNRHNRVSISISNDFINESFTTNSDHKNQETEFHSIHSANTSSILNSISKNNKSTNMSVNANAYPFDNSQIKHLDTMDSLEYLTISNNDHTNFSSHYSNSIKSLRKKKYAVQRTDTMQTYETACSSMFKSISSENENFKYVDDEDDDDDIEEYDDEEDEDEDEVFKDCTLEFPNTKGKNEFEFF